MLLAIGTILIDASRDNIMILWTILACISGYFIYLVIEKIIAWIIEGFKAE